MNSVVQIDTARIERRIADMRAKVRAAAASNNALAVYTYTVELAGLLRQRSRDQIEQEEIAKGIH